MTSKARIGIVGTSWWADSHHLPNITSHPKAELAAVCGRNEARAREMTEKYGGKEVYTDYEEMMEKGGLDGVIVAAPDDLHYHITMAAIEAGLHVCCEKPLASTLEQAREMYEKAEAAGIIHMTYFTLRWMPHYKYLASLLDQGYLGQCYHGSLEWLYGVGRGGNYWWRFDDDRADGMLGDICSHYIDLSRMLLGEITGVSARLTNFVERTKQDGTQVNPANDTASLSLDFACGAHCRILASAVAHVGQVGYEQDIRLYGENGSLRVEVNMFGAQVSGLDAKANKLSPLTIPDQFWGKADRVNPYSVFQTEQAGSRLFVEAILKGEKVSPSFYEGLKVQEIIAAAKESDASGRTVALE